MKRIVCIALTVLCLLGCLSCGVSDPPKQYYFFIYNSSKLSEADISAIHNLRELYTAHDIVMLDADGLTTSAEVYRLLQRERDAQGSDPEGIQIFGAPHAVPSFTLRYEIEIFPSNAESEISTHDDFVSDYFYTNLDNMPEDLDGISAYQLANSLETIDIYPDWSVVRLPLSKGQFYDFFAKYREYLSLAVTQETVSISVASPIFPVGWYSVAMDDFGYFLMRARDEWGFIDDLRMYGTTEGVYASTLELDGSCDAQNWAHLTETQLCEIYHDSHAGQTALMQTIFDGSRKEEYHCTKILSSETINTVLDGMPYFLNTNGCEPAKTMMGNIISTSLRGRCVGAFASTTRISNVDVDCMMPADDYDGGYTKYSLYYEYLRAKSEGASRAEAFLAGQRQLAVSLAENADELHTHSLQTNLNNLLGLHNFGLIDP